MRASFWHSETFALRKKSRGDVEDVTLSQVLHFLSVKTAQSPKSRNPVAMAERVTGPLIETRINISNINGCQFTYGTRMVRNSWVCAALRYLGLLLNSDCCITIKYVLLK